MYAVYILLCTDNSYYTGLNNDFDKRIWQHETGFFQNVIHLDEDQSKLHGKLVLKLQRKLIN